MTARDGRLAELFCPVVFQFVFVCGMGQSVQLYFIKCIFALGGGGGCSYPV